MSLVAGRLLHSGLRCRQAHKRRDYKARGIDSEIRPRNQARQAGSLLGRPM